MPCTRKPLPDTFEEDPNDASRVVCMLCSRRLARSVTITRGRIKRHSNTAEHKASVSSDTIRKEHIDWGNTGILDDVFEHDDRVYDYQGNEILFDAGGSNDTSTQKHLAEELEHFELWGEYQDLCEGDDDEDVAITNVMAHMRNIGFEDDSDGDEDPPENMEPSTKSRWFPYPSKTMFVLDLLDSMPRLRFSNNALATIIWAMKHVHQTELPSLKALRKIQGDLCKKVGPETAEIKTTMGNTFSVNTLQSGVAKDFACPLIREEMKLYIVDPGDGPVSETFHAAKAQDTDPDLDSPMYADHYENHYYRNEIAKLHNGQYAIVHQWRMTSEGLCADVNHVDVDIETAHDWATFMPNPLRAKANGKRLYTVHLNVWADDVSGARSKQYNEHYNIYYQNSGIPHKKLAQEFFVRFASASTHATSLEQLNAQSLECSHIGMGGNLPCWRCKVGGSNAEKETVLYETLYKPGAPRDPDKTLEEVKRQLSLAAQGVSHNAMNLEQQKSGVKDSIAETFICRLCTVSQEMTGRSTRRKLTSTEQAALQKILDDITGTKWNKLLELKSLGLNVHTDTPDELLHLYLLGQDKYVWHILHNKWDPRDAPLFLIRLESACLKGLTLPPVRAKWILKHSNGLVGKHFKALQQLAVFEVHGLKLGPYIFDLLKATGELGAHLWFPKIRKMEQFLSDLKIYIDNVLDIWSLIDPGRILDKGKLHTLLHFIDDIRRFGPAIGPWKALIYGPPAILFSTEGFECFNAIFRMCSVLSNRLAPSRNITLQFSHMDCFKHIISGGFWRGTNGHFIQAGDGMRAFMNSEKLVQRNLGYIDKKDLVPGTAKLKSAKKHGAAKWCETRYAMLDPPITIEADSVWEECSYVIGQHQDICVEQSWDPLTIERIQSVLQRVTDPTILVIVEVFLLAEARSKRYNMPQLLAGAAGPRLRAFLAKDVHFDFNAQHDCLAAGCSTSGTRPVRQERSDTAATEPIWVHNTQSTSSQYLVNMHALHNADLIREALPRTLTEPIAYLKDRVSSHQASSAIVSGQRTQRRAKAAEKAKERAAQRRAGEAGTGTQDKGKGKRNRGQGSRRAEGDAGLANADAGLLQGGGRP
ncbi:hypothetical protein BOTBODRAFT_57961 [Botryobasidium botryosum FD-172 SS1]|uniref:Uncharacterized protein n=1 Tax=Botryobasidium botryosum (strain FD-172 SS1) TaxID=930990 RepID=A0A067MG57_BOTB1|nr:hypothetical protein BOTBODRAFT_57961 [Botryobasidium botryosum FD-172 SS1]